MRTTAVMCMLLGVAATMAIAQAPRTIPFEGRLSKPTGAPVANGTYNVTLSLYAVPSGGSPMWSEAKAVTTVAGVFNTALGSATPFPSSVTFNSPYFVGVALPPDAEMTPRLPLSSVPYAIGLALPTLATTTYQGAALAIGNAGTGSGILGRRTSTTGTDPGILGITDSTDPSATAIQGIVSSPSTGVFSAAVRGINYGTSGLGIGVYGSYAGSGWGVYGFANGGYGVYGSTPQGVGVFGQSTSNSGLQGISSTGTGVYATSSTGSAGQFVSPAGSPADAVTITHAGIGRGLSIATDSGIALSATSNTGTPAQLTVPAGSTATALVLTQNGSGTGLNVSAASGYGVYSVSTDGTALYGSTSAMSGAGLIGKNLKGEGIVGMTLCDLSGSVVGRNDGLGSGVRGFTTKSGPGVLGTGGSAGGTGAGGRFEVINAVSAANALEAVTSATGNALYVNHTGVGTSTTTLRNLAVFQTNGANEARIDNNGRGFFNGGAQYSGADVAEDFAVEGSRAAYEPGDVLVISERTDRTMEKCAEAYSTRVAGVVAKKPGVLLTERDVDEDQSDLVPLGVIGVIPTKVCAGNGSIRRGDLLVTSTRPGVAMKAGSNPPAGSIIGKALAPFDGADAGLIEVLVNVR
ncbi:MAG TPA: hypothetical protein VGM51_08555 [Armatimonadota bacterium]